MRILVIEDDRKAAHLLADGLQEERFIVDVNTGQALRKKTLEDCSGTDCSGTDSGPPLEPHAVNDGDGVVR